MYLVLPEIGAAQRVAHQPPRAHHNNRQNSSDLAREAVGCMGVFGGAIASAARYQSHQSDQAFPWVSSTARRTISSVEMSGQSWVCSHANINACSGVCGGRVARRVSVLRPIST